MVFTAYNPAEALDRDKVRGLIGDTVSTSYYLDDETIAAVLTARGSVLEASIECVRRILAKIARDGDYNAVGISASRNPVTMQFRDLLKDLTALRGQDLDAVMFVGGKSRSANQATIDNDDNVDPVYYRGMDDNATIPEVE